MLKEKLEWFKQKSKSIIKFLELEYKIRGNQPFRKIIFEGEEYIIRFYTERDYGLLELKLLDFKNKIKYIHIIEGYCYFDLFKNDYKKIFKDFLIDGRYMVRVIDDKGEIVSDKNKDEINFEIGFRSFCDNDLKQILNNITLDNEILDEDVFIMCKKIGKYESSVDDEEVLKIIDKIYKPK